MKKRFLSILLTLCMVTVVIPFIPTAASAANIQYVVAGTSNLFGKNWNFSTTTGKVMTENESGIYELILSSSGACGEVQFKIAKLTDGVVVSDSDYYGDSSGNNFKIFVNGACEVLITFAPSTMEITASGDYVTDANSLRIDSMRIVGNGDPDEGKWLNGVTWDPTDDANLMTETSPGVYEITYNDIDAYDGYEFRFAANGSWTDNWGGSTNSEAAVYNGDSAILIVENDHSTVKIVLDLTNFDYTTKLGAVYSIYVSAQANSTTIDGNTFTFSGNSDIDGCTVILALYKDGGNELVDCQTATYNNEPITFTTTATDYTSAMVMVWNDLEALEPAAEVEIVDLGQRN